jgi:hypothetical protein
MCADGVAAERFASATDRQVHFGSRIVSPQKLQIFTKKFSFPDEQQFILTILFDQAGKHGRQFFVCGDFSQRNKAEGVK